MKKTFMLSTFAAALLLAGSLCVSAQDTTGGMNGNKGKSDSKMDSKKMDSKMGMMMSATDTDFANMAAMGGNAEVKWAELAMQKSTNAGVKKYASKMMKDHMKANKNLMKVAMKNNMTLPTAMSDEQMQVMSQLQQASGADFDRMYIQMSGVDAHQKMAALFQTEAGSGSDAALKGFAAKTLPVVQMHLKMAQDMAGGNMMNGKKDSMKSSM